MDVGDAMWEEELLPKSQFPYFNLEDKVGVRGGSDDRDEPISKEEGVLANKGTTFT